MPPLPNSHSQNSPAPSEQSLVGKKRSSKWRPFVILAAGILLVGGGAGLITTLFGGAAATHPDLLLHTVKFESLAMTIVERGTLESSENRDVTCHVKASKGGSFSTTIKWVIEDGTRVEQGQHIITLDSAALDAQRKDQNIVVLNAQAALIKARTAAEVTREDNKKLLLAAENALRGAELDVEKYVGLPRGTLMKTAAELRREYIRQIETDLVVFLDKYRSENKSLDGEFQQLLDDVSGRIEQAEAEHEQWKDKSAYSQRMVIKGYITQSQAQADESRLSSAGETLKKLRTEKRLLQTFVAQKTARAFCSLFKEAEVSHLSAISQTQSKAEEVAAELQARTATLEQEQAKLLDIDEQIKECQIYAPQKGMVVYYVPEQSRSGGGSQTSIVAQGEPVRDGQKLMRIPDLDRMQVVARVHEATISRIRADKSANLAERVLAASMVNRNFLPQLALLQEEVLKEMKHGYAELENDMAERGQKARIRVDAFADKPLTGYVHFVAGVASQDFFSSDVKVYPTVVLIDDKLPGLRPGMSAEVTIEVANPLERVLTVPIQAVLGGPESGDKRKVYVMTDNGPQEREVRIGLSNDEKVEVREGIEEGDRVVTNLRALLGDKVKTRDPAEAKSSAGKGKGKSKPGEPVKK